MDHTSEMFLSLSIKPYSLECAVCNHIRNIQEEIYITLTSVSLSPKLTWSIEVPMTVVSGMLAANGPPLKKGPRKFLYMSVVTVAFVADVLEGDLMS